MVLLSVKGNDAVLSLNSSGNLTVSGTICGNDGVDCIGTIPSSRQWKTVVSDVNVNDVLRKVSQLAISTWRYNHQSESKAPHRAYGGGLSSFIQPQWGRKYKNCER